MSLQVQSKLKLTSIESIYLVAVSPSSSSPIPSDLLCALGSRRRPVMPIQSGEKITKLDDLQDIDELHVEDVRAQFMYKRCDMNAIF